MAVARTKTDIMARLGAAGLGPRKLRGQHFLIDGNFLDAIVRHAAVGPGDAVLEIGTGTGVLTDPLADRAGAVLSVDIDARLQAIARQSRAWPETVRFFTGDVLAGKHRLNPDLCAIWAEVAGKLRRRLVANLPYNIATPLLANVLWSGGFVDDAVVLVQREAAERFVARVGSGAYGPMSIAVSLLAEARILRHVGPHIFWPPPKVESALLALRVRDAARARAWREAGLPELLATGFRWRRKTLRRAFPAARLEAAGIDPGARPQEVPPEAWPSLLTVPPS
ncbi:MAG: 16S rRNA (adenine(1518)-N(6)/adenine(1519)-N(6))-dimethyltransferase RsmA [Planctomycetota bacterium]|nr:16S rRNA (adenine(1518)-N(6)/adenine(1519)-N(6))-dimethyltransferase RsmA [Planctomycetota bacterium]